MALNLRYPNPCLEEASLGEKFTLNYKKTWESKEGSGERPDGKGSVQGAPSGTRRSYLHNHRIADALDEYRNQLQE